MRGARVPPGDARAPPGAGAAAAFLINGERAVEALGLGPSLPDAREELGQGLNACGLCGLPSGLLDQGVLFAVTRAQDLTRGNSFSLGHPLVPSRVQSL